MKRVIVAIAALAALAALAAGSAVAGGAAHGKALYRYVGQVDSTTGSSVSVTVQGGNRAALRSLIGQSQQQTFATGDKTVFLTWAKGIPSKAGIGDLAAGDYVAVNVRADRGASIDAVRSTAAALVGDHGPTRTKPTQPLYLFRGTVVSAGGGSVTIDVKGGNHRALKLMLGQGARQTFSTGDETVFLQWSKRIPTVIDASKLVPGQPVIVRVRAAKDATLGTVEATAAKRVAEHEPKGQEQKQSEQS